MLMRPGARITRRRRWEALGVAGTQPTAAKMANDRRDPSRSDPPPLGLGPATSRSGKKSP